MDRPEGRDALGTTLGIAIEPTYFDLERAPIDPEEIVAMAVRCQANTLRVGMFSHQGHAYYPSGIAPHAPGLDGRDLLKAFQTDCAEAGITLAIYMNSKYDTQCYHEHPDWAIQFGGEARVHEKEADLHIFPMCPNSPYLDYFRSLLEELAGNYGPEIVYIDNFGVHPACECRFCAEAFREACGMDLPEKTDWHDTGWQAHRRWSRERSFVLGRRLTDAVREARPGTLVVYNRGIYRTMTGQGNPEDIHTFAHEIADNVHGESAVRFYGHSFSHINEQCLFGRSIDTPMWTWVEYPLLPWSHVAAPPSEVKIKAAKVLANGGRPMVWNVPRAPDCDERGLEGLAEVFGLAARYPEYFSHTAHVPFLGVLYSSQTMEAYCRVRRDRFEDCQKEFSGTLALARHAHLQTDVLLDWHIAPETLSGYSVLVLPNAAAMSEEQCAAVTAFVDAGGGLIATGVSSMFDEEGEPRGDFGIGEILGARYGEPLRTQSEGRSTGYSVIEGAHPVTDRLGEGFRLPVGGSYVAVQVADSGCRLSTLLSRCRYYCDHPGQSTGHPALIAHQFGSGRVLYVPGPIGAVYAERGFPDYQTLLADAVDWACPQGRPIRTTLPDSVEATLTRTPGGALVVHLVNCSADLSRPVTGVGRVVGCTMTLCPEIAGPIRVRALVADVDLSHKADGDAIRFDLPPLDEYEVVVVDQAG